MYVLNLQLLNFQSSQNDNSISFISLPNVSTTFIIWRNHINGYSLIISSSMLVVNIQNSHFAQGKTYKYTVPPLSFTKKWQQDAWYLSTY